jgi:hypothetical protein
MIAGFGGALVLLGAFFLPFGAGLTVLAFVLGPAVIALAALATSRPRNARGAGSAIVVLGLLSVVTGGGFYVGWILAVVGGILIASPRWGGAPNAARPGFSADALGPPCPRCGRHIPTWTSQCPYCGTPDDRA